MTASVRCPHCGAAILGPGPSIVPAEIRKRLLARCNGTSLEAAVLRTLTQHFGQNVASEIIIIACYGSREPPLTVENALRVRISQLRHVVAPLGLIIANERFPCAYRLDHAP